MVVLNTFVIDRSYPAVSCRVVDFANFLTTSLTGDVIKQSAGVVSSYASSIADFFSSAFTDGKSSIVQIIADIGQVNKKVGVIVENKTAGVLSSVTGFFTNLFSNDTPPASQTIIPIKQSDSSRDETVDEEATKIQILQPTTLLNTRCPTLNHLHQSLLSPPTTPPHRRAGYNLFQTSREAKSSTSSNNPKTTINLCSIL